MKIKKIISLTENAVLEIKRRLAEKKNEKEKEQKQSKQPSNEGLDDFGLRLGIKGGGCSGLSYLIEIDKPRPDDVVQEEAEVKLYMDRRSTLYLRDSILEYEGGFMGSGFKFKNPNAENTCGCGESFSI